MRQFICVAMRVVSLIVIVFISATQSFAQSVKDSPDDPSAGTMSSRDILRAAIAAAGGEYWLNPQTLYLKGYGLFWTKGDNLPKVVDDYRMWRVYDQSRQSAHEASGMVRIDAKVDGKVWFQQAYDGETSYSHKGIVPPEKASKEWASAFGFGIIRNALDPGFVVKRLPDDTVDGRATYTVSVADPKGEMTIFGIDQQNFHILMVGFNTPKGWHQRIYSEFYTQAQPLWVQPGRVRLYYNGIKSNEIHWTEFAVNKEYPRGLFQLTKP